MDFENAWNVVNTSMSTVLSWVESIFEKTGALPYWLSAIFFIMVCRFIILPFTGSLGSFDSLTASSESAAKEYRDKKKIRDFGQTSFDLE